MESQITTVLNWQIPTNMQNETSTSYAICIDTLDVKERILKYIRIEVKSLKINVI